MKMTNVEKAHKATIAMNILRNNLINQAAEKYGGMAYAPRAERKEIQAKCIDEFNRVYNQD